MGVCEFGSEESEVRSRYSLMIHCSVKKSTFGGQFNNI